MRTIQLLFGLPRGSTPRSIRDPYVDVDAQDPGNPPHPPPPDPGHPPLTPATIRDLDPLRATLQDRALTTPLGWYRLQEDWTKLTVKALRDLTTPGNGLYEAIVRKVYSVFSTVFLLLLLLVVAVGCPAAGFG